MNYESWFMELPIEKQLRIETLRRALKELPRDELEEMLIETTTALVKLTTNVQDFFREHGLI
jgi:hypothetical protein